MRTMNLGILAHVDAGKTSLTERLLFEAGAINKLGSVDAGNTQTDSLELERQRGITIKAAVASFALGDVTVNLVDTPGHPDFIAEVERTLGVLDAAIVVVSAVEGVQAQTRVLVRALRRLQVPFLFFINKVDRLGANYDGVVHTLTEQLELSAVTMSRVTGAGGKTSEVKAIDFDAGLLRGALIDLLIENDEALFADVVLDPVQVTGGRLRKALAAQVAANQVYPAFAGSAATGAGLQELTAGIEALLPSATPAPLAPVRGKVFKIDRGWGGEKQAYVALKAGTIRLRDLLALPKGLERVTGIHVFDAGKLRRSDQLQAGEIGRVAGLASAVIGDGVGEGATSDRLTYFAPPTLETQVLARSPSDRQALWSALGQLAEQDPLINLRHDDQNGDIFLSLYGEVQKEVIGTTLEQDFGLAVDFLESTVICAERVEGSGEAAEIIGNGHNPFLATVGLRVVSRPPSSGNSFSFDVNSGLMPAGFYRAVEEAVAETLKQGRYGWPVIDCHVTMTMAGQSAPESTAGDFRLLAPLVLASALAKATTAVCEPVSKFRIDTPPDSVGALLALLGQAGATLSATNVEERAARLEGAIVTAAVQGVQRQLPDLTGGSAAMEAVFDHYAPMPRPSKRPHMGANPFDRSGYMAKVRR